MGRGAGLWIGVRKGSGHPRRASPRRRLAGAPQLSDKKNSDNSPEAGGDYGADKIRHLEGIDGIRHRPSMYIGFTDTVGLHHILFEVTDNVLDEYVNGYAKTLSVTINADGSVTVVDDGRGIPVGIMKDKGQSALEVVFTQIHAGGKFDREAYAEGTGGLHGVESQPRTPAASGLKRRSAAKVTSGRWASPPVG